MQTTTQEDGASYTYVPGAKDVWSGPGGDSNGGATTDQLDVYWSRSYGDADLPEMHTLYPASEYIDDATDSVDYDEYGWAAFASETDFSYR